MKNLLEKINIIDAATIAVVLLVVAIGSVYYLHKPAPETTKLNVTVEISEPSQVSAVSDSAIGSKIAFLNSINIELESRAVLQGGSLLIELTGSGHTESDGYYIFNGQRILVGQKAEIHGSYFAQGKIVKIENAKK